MLSWIYERVQHPGLIFYWLYVLSAFAITLGFLVFVKRAPLRAALRLMASKDVWATKTTATDLVLSSGYALFLRAPASALQAGVVAATWTLLHEHVIRGRVFPFPMALPAPVEAALVTLLTMLAIDFATYVVHVAFHKWSFLWLLHAVHHSAGKLTPLTTHRQHPLEPFLLNVGRGFFAGVAMTGFYYVFPQGTPVLSIMGLGAGFFIYMFTVNLQHSHVPVRYPRWLSLVILSPHSHHIHHSAAKHHHDKNYGVVFPFWDRLFGTFHDEPFDSGDLEFGLGADDPFEHDLVKCLWYPLKAPFERRDDERDAA